MVTRKAVFEKREHQLSLHIQVSGTATLMCGKRCPAYSAYAGLKAADLAGIIAFLRTVSPLQCPPEPRFDGIETGLWVLGLTRFLDANRPPPRI
jgi:hypothetical protein